jgi:hypothetical protein
MTQLHEGVTEAAARAGTGWELEISENPAITPTPSPEELAALRELVNRR